MSERTPMPDETKKFAPDPAIEAAISAKIEAAMERGVDLAILTVGPEDGKQAVFDEIGCTAEEKLYMEEFTLYRMVQIALGERVVDTLNRHGCRIARDNLIPCISAYLEALETGEYEARGRARSPVPEAPFQHASADVEARVLTDLLTGFGIVVTIPSDEPRLFFEEFQNGTKQIALIAEGMATRFQEDFAFRDAMIAYVGSTGGLRPTAPDC